MHFNTVTVEGLLFVLFKVNGYFSEAAGKKREHSDLSLDHFNFLNYPHLPRA